MRTQSRLSAVIIRLCRLCPTEIDVKVNLFQICDPRGEVAATSSHLVSQRQTESRFRPRQHVKSGSNYHCCSNICISESDKLLTLCDILTVSPAVQLSRQTHLTQQLLVCCFKSCSYHRKMTKTGTVPAKAHFSTNSVAKIVSRVVLFVAEEETRVFARGPQSVVD